MLKTKGQAVDVVTVAENGVTRRQRTSDAVFGIELKYADGKTVLVGDKRVLLSAVGSSAPIDSTSFLVIGKVRHAVVNSSLFAPGSDAVFFNVLAWAGG